MAKYPHLSIASQASINGVNPKLLTALDKIAMAGGYTISINSGYRSPDYSQKVGGYANDPHSRGEAVDAYIGGKPIGEVIPLSTFQRFGLEGGNQPGFYNGKADAEHVQIPGSGVHKDMTSPVLSQATGVPGTGNVPPDGMTNGSTSQWPASAVLAYTLGIKNGLTPQQAKDFAAVQYGESGFNPNARNKDSGAAGLYQLLSQGYVDKANALGGVFNPKANIMAILPNYVSYYKSHPFQPGAAGASVEASGKGPDYYAAGWGHLPGMPGSQPTTGDTTTPTTDQGTKQAPPYDPSTAILQMLRLAGSGGGPTYKPVNLAVPPMPVQTGGGLPQANFKPFGIGPLQTP